MTSFSLAFLVAFVLTGLIVRLSRGRQMPWQDDQTAGVQKFHRRPVPRVGGVGIAGGVAAVVFAVALGRIGPAGDMGLILFCGVPAFIAGLAEDFTKRVSPRTRLVATMISGAMAFYLLDAELKSVEFPGLDTLMTYTWFSLAFTMIATAGVANAVNIIDGYNGLTAVVGSVMLLSMVYVAWQVGDNLIVSAGLAGVGSLLGFFVWNWPRGLIFLGDGGAYFLGYFVAALSFLLVSRHAQEVSPWYPLLLAIYPVFETLFSIWRKRFVRGRSPGVPDGLHLHMLVFRRLVRWAVGRQDAASLTLRNSLTAPYLWLLSSLAALPATLFWRQPTLLKLFVAVFCMTYVWLYLRLVRFRAPRWLMVRGRRGGPLSRFKDGL